MYQILVTTWIAETKGHDSKAAGVHTTSVSFDSKDAADKALKAIQKNTYTGEYELKQRAIPLY